MNKIKHRTLFKTASLLTGLMLSLAATATCKEDCQTQYNECLTKAEDSFKGKAICEQTYKKCLMGCGD